MIRRAARLFPILLLILLVLAACAPAMAPTPAPAPAEQTKQNEKPSEPTKAQETQPTATAFPERATQAQPAVETPVQPQTTPVIVESRVVEMEWPERLRMGDSDIIRLALLPVKDGYVAQAEFADHTIQTRAVPVPRPNGYTLYALARLDGVAFDISPTGDQERYVAEGEEVSWRWTLAPRSPGKHSLSVQMRLRWVPSSPADGAARESLAYGRGINVNVSSFLGMSPSQAAKTGTFGLLIGCGILLVAYMGRGRPVSRSVHGNVFQPAEPNEAVSIESAPAVTLSVEESSLLRALFATYHRLSIENEFLSGYSGARTFLVRPERMDGGSDALTIVKLGPRPAIQQEFRNYETFVKDRLPPVTARIQRAPVVLSAKTTPSQRAAMQYTFIAEPGHSPVSLRRALLEDPNPALLLRLFETFGQNWWMQRRPYAFRLAQEYDALLPPHVVLEPLAAAPTHGLPIRVGEKDDPAALRLSAGDIVLARAFHKVELRADGQSLALAGDPADGRPALRLRWLSTAPPENTPARVTATRMDLLRGWTAGFDRFGLPDPLDCLPALLEETVSGTRSVIHGDLNLENVLVGPGSLVWLIDFAQTREGHPLYDFAHLESELIAHVLAPRAGSPRAFLEPWQSGADPLVNALHAIAGRCLFDLARPREYHLALYMACLGALKYPNLPALSRHCLYLAAADLWK